jgi:hypothetical protein
MQHLSKPNSCPLLMSTARTEPVSQVELQANTQVFLACCNGGATWSIRQQPPPPQAHNKNGYENLILGILNIFPWAANAVAMLPSSGCGIASTSSSGAPNSGSRAKCRFFSRRLMSEVSFALESCQYRDHIHIHRLADKLDLK